MYYGDKREAKVNIMAELVERGWEVFGYTPDRSDSMTDYYAPAHWNGIATKNGFVLVIDNNGTYYSGYEVKEYNYNKQAYKASDRIEKLTAMMNDTASTENEKASCAALIEKEKEKQGIKPSYTVKETYPTFTQGNPKSCSWHIEFDGQVVGQGTGVFACYEGNDHIEANRIKRDKKINALVDRIESCMKSAEAFETKIVKVPVTSIKPVEIERKEMKKGDIIKLYNNHNYWIIEEVNENGVYIIRLGKNYKQLTKNQTNYYRYSFTSLTQSIAKGNTKLFELKEVTEYTEKTVTTKTKRTQKASDAVQIESNEVATEQPAEQPEQATEAAQTETMNAKTVTGEATLTINNEKNGIEITFTSKPSTNVIEALKENGFRWSSYGSKWWVKQSPERLKFATKLVESYNSIMQEEPEQNESEAAEDVVEVTEQAETVKEPITEVETDPYAFNVDMSYLYHDLHFKAWNYSVEDITELLNITSINYYECGEKFICTGLTVEQVEQIEMINKDNGAIIFYDDKYNELRYNSEAAEEPAETVTEQEQEKVKEEPVIINGKIKVKEITFIWSESRLIADGLTVSTFAEAEQLIRQAAKDVNGGYDKTKFIITWTDGDTYEGRIDIEKDYEEMKTPIKDHITDWLLFLTGDKKPAHMTDKAYSDTLTMYNISDKEKQEYYDFMERYALIDIEPNDYNSQATSEPAEQQDNVIYHNFNNIDNSNNEIGQEENEPMTTTFDDIFSKFDNIEITTESKVSAEDLVFCQEQEDIYKQLINTYSNFRSQLDSISILSNEHGKKYGKQSDAYFHTQNTAFYYSMSKHDIISTIDKMKNSFVGYVCSYFEKKYSITIDKDAIKNKYDENITYENIIDEIFMQLGGYNFTEKAEQEIKEKAKNSVRNSDKITIKNSKLIIDGHFSYHDSIWKEYKLSGQYSELFKALQHFENGSTAGNAELISKYCGYNNERNLSNYERYEPQTLNKVKSIKFLKNGKLEIEFTSNQQATSFAGVYCGYNQKSA